MRPSLDARRQKPLPLKELATVSFGFRLKMNNKESHENSMY